MKRLCFQYVCILLCFMILSGCSCSHEWIDANCETAKTCIVCNETQGKPKGHTPGQWKENIDPVKAEVYREQVCTDCDQQIGSETATLDTLIENERYLFTPKQFLERLSFLVREYKGDLSYDYADDAGTLLDLSCGGKDAYLQFFKRDASLMKKEESESKEVWCVSLAYIGGSDPILRRCFFMACDPALSINDAERTDLTVIATALNGASSGEVFDYFTSNGLLYECGYVVSDDMYAIEVYASDFR